MQPITKGIQVLNLTQQDIDHLTILDIRLYVFGGALLPMAIIGIILNSFTILVLLHPRMRNSTNVYLTALSLTNVVCLLNFIFLYSLRYLLSYKSYETSITNKEIGLEVNMYESFLNRYIRFFSPIFSTFQLYAIYLTCAVTIDRFIYLRWPLRAESICTIKTTIRVSIIIFAFCSLYNLPRWFEVTSDSMRNERTNVTYYQAKATDLARNMWYRRIFAYYCYLIFVYGVPFLILLFVNIGIIKKLIEMQDRKSTLLGVSQRKKTMTECHAASISETQKNKTGSDKNESHRSMKIQLKIDPKITFMVLAVVVAFFLCQFPMLILHLAQTLASRKEYQIAKVFCDFLAALNCCINFLIYCFFGTNFRRIAKYILLHPAWNMYNPAKMQNINNKEKAEKIKKANIGSNKQSKLKFISSPNFGINNIANQKNHKPIIMKDEDPLQSPLISYESNSNSITKKNHVIGCNGHKPIIMCGEENQQMSPLISDKNDCLNKNSNNKKETAM